MHACARMRTEQLEDVVRVRAGAAREAQHAAGLLQDLGVGRVQLLVGHAVHDRHEALDARRALLLLALHAQNRGLDSFGIDGGAKAGIKPADALACLPTPVRRLRQHINLSENRPLAAHTLR